MPHVGAKSRATQAVTADTKKTVKKPAGVRAAIAEIVNTDATKEKIQALLDEAFNATANADAVCPSCGEEMKVRVRDVKKAADTLIALIEQSEGRPEQRQQESTQVTIVRPPL